MSDIFTGNGFKLFYNTDTGNQLPDSYKNTQIESLAVMPNVTFNSDTNTIEVYDGYYSTKLLGDKTVNDIEIVVNYIPDNPSHAFLDNAVETQQEFQLIIQYQTDEEGMIDYSIINGQLSSKQITGDKDEVVQATYTFSPSEVAIRSARAAASIPLVEGSYGVGSNGDTVPQYQPDLPTGNSFIKIPAASTDNPAGSDVMGIGLIDQDTFSSLAMTKSGALALYAKNGSTAWTRIVTSPMADAKYLPFSGGTITGNLSITGILTLTNPLAVANGGTGAATVTSARTNLDVYSRGEVDAINVVLDTKIDTINDNLNSKINVAEEVLDTKIDTVNDDLNSKIDQVNTDISNVYTKAQIDTTVAMLVPKTTTVNGKALSGNITLTKTDVGLGNVTNDLQLKAASNLSDLNNVATARGNLGLTALGLGGTPTTLSTMDWLTQLFVVGGLYVVAAGGMTNVPADLIFEDATTITMIRVVATDGTFLTCEVWPSTSTASKFRMYNVRFPAGTTSNRTFWVRQIFDNSGVIPVINGGTGATTAAAARTNLGFGTVATYNIGTSGETIPLLSTANTWSSNQSIQGNLSVGAPAQTSTINLGGSSFSRDNGTSALIITSNSGTTSGSAGLYLRPMGDTVSTVQLYGNSTGWTFQGALNASSTLRVNGATTLSGSLAVTGASTFSGSYNGNRAAIDLTGSTTDLNTCFISASLSGHEQVWICTTQGGGSAITNKPTGVTGSFWLQSASTRVNGVADSGYKQTLYSYETSKTYVRYGKSTSATAGTWATWQEVMSASDNGDLYVGANVPNAINSLSQTGLSLLNGRGVKQIVNSVNEIALITPSGDSVAINNSSNAFRAAAYRGTFTAPQATKADDELWLGLMGYTGSEFTVMHSAIRAYATDDWTQSSRGAGLQFQTTATGTATRRSVWQIGAGGALAPSNDNAYDIGGSSLRVKTIFAASGTINTSDARLKTEVRPFADNEIAAAIELGKEIGFYKWLESIEGKGDDDAREHCGMTVQKAIEIMKKYNLDPMSYGFICHDSWDENTVVDHYDESDKPVYRTDPAGDRYSFRFDQLSLFIARGQEARLEIIDAKLSALESK
ncbi:TPA: tail fiber domain-containing protein [Raoultella ornithinolytica]|nr:tail fiber domain-containing protein [Raoultella ornithinolytica]